MEHIKYFYKRCGVDVGYHESSIHPKNRIGCIGKRGLDKNLSLVEIIKIAYDMDQKPNILVKAGPNAKWYLKKCDLNILDSEIEKQKWRDVSRYIMYIIEWD